VASGETVACQILTGKSVICSTVRAVGVVEGGAGSTSATGRSLGAAGWVSQRPEATSVVMAKHAARTGQTVTSYDVATRTKSGQMRWISVSILVSPANEDNPAPLVVHLFRDATKKKQREKFILQMLDEAERIQAATLPLMPPTSTESLADELTDREREVLSLLAQGLNTHDIAKSLSISSSTVRNHVQNILNKLQVHSRLEAVAYAFEHGLVDRA